MNRAKALEQISYIAYSAAWKLTAALPEERAYVIFAKLGDWLYHRDGSGVERLRSNYRRIHPELSYEAMEDLVRDGVRSYMRYWCDTFRIHTWSRDRILSTVVVENENYLRDPIRDGRGVIVSLPHAGNWDHAGAYFCETGVPLVTVAEHLKPEKLFQKFLAHRTRMGFEVLDANVRSMATLSQRLRSNRLVALVADRDLSKSGSPVTFFDGPARMPVGPALLSIQTGAPLITAYVAYEGEGIRIIFGPEIPVPAKGSNSEKVAEMIQTTADWFAERLSERTVDWHMLQRIWVDGDFKERE